MHDKYLEHYGIPGMKWGRRTASSQILIGGPTSGGTNNSNGSYKQSSSGGKQTNSGSNGKKKSKPYVDAKWRDVTDDGPSTKKPGSNKQSTGPKPNTETTTNKKQFDPNIAKDGVKTSKQIAETGSKMLSKNREKLYESQLKKEMTNLTNEEMQTVIKRLSTEQRYMEVMKKEGVNVAKSNLETTLDTIGTVAGYAETALNVYGAIQGVRGRK